MLDTQTRPELPHLTASARLVAGALAGVHEVTVTALHETAGVSKSAVAKTLVALERAGAACRTVQEVDGVRYADLWSPGPELGALLFTAEAATSGYGHAASLLNANDVADSQQSDTAAESGGVIESSMGEDAASESDEVDGALGGETPSPLPDSNATPAEQLVTEEPEERSTPDGVRDRLASGGLAEMVASALAANPDIEYTPTMLSHLLQGRSAGAISNALEKMHRLGTAVRVCEKPKRYRHVSGDAAGS